MSKPKPRQSAKHGEPRNLRVVLKMDFGPDCPLNDPPANVADVEMQLTENGCQIDFIVKGDSPGEAHQVHHQVMELDEDCTDFSDCVCCIFRDYDCVPHPLGYHGDALFVATYLPDRASGTQLISDLREVSSVVTLVQITENHSGIISEIKEVDLGLLSDKQKQALQIALAADYFGPGDGGTLNDLAEDLEISSSALSQRISRAEAEILKQLFE